MKTNITSQTAGQRQQTGFTLIEMIGVLAVIAILAALLVPKVTSAISDAKVNNAISSYQTIQTAAASHYSKYNAFNITNNVAIGAGAFPFQNWDNCLISEGYLDQPVNLKIGTGASLNVVVGAGNLAGAGYKLDGVNVGTSANAYTVELVVTGVAEQDAYDVASRLDGTGLAGTAPQATLTGGRVTYTSVAGVGTLYMYIAGR